MFKVRTQKAGTNASNRNKSRTLNRTLRRTPILNQTNHTQTKQKPNTTKTMSKLNVESLIEKLASNNSKYTQILDKYKAIDEKLKNNEFITQINKKSEVKDFY